MKKAVVVVLHVGYWALYLLLIICFIRVIPVGGGARSPFAVERGSPLGLLHILFGSPIGLFALLPGLLGFYSFYTVLYTRFLKRKKIVALVLFGGMVAVAGGILTLLVLYFSWLRRLNPAQFWGSIVAVLSFLSLLTLVHGIIGLVLRGFITSYDDIQLKEDLNKKNDAMELALIKSQINPHFLFNTLNNIDVLIGKDPGKASAYLKKLSDILRFMLYETKTDKIELATELSYIEKYIDLHRIRTANPDYVNYRVEGDVGAFRIEPMLFIPFIENAFKHAENKKKENAILIRFEVGASGLVFFCENKCQGGYPGKRDHSGLGNGLIRKRLALLYPGMHELEIRMEDEMYKVKLALVKDANELYDNRG